MIVFLDIDDVLCTMEAHIAAAVSANYGEPPDPRWPFRHAISKEAVSLLNAAISEAAEPVKYVCCSTWRKHLSCGQIYRHLARAGFTGIFHDDWATPLVGDRGQEIAAWLENHPEVTRYAIVDDNHDAASVLGWERFTHVKDQRVGFTRAEHDRLVEILKI